MASVQQQELNFICTGIYSCAATVEDRTTASVWAHHEGVCIHGPHKGTLLERVPTLHMTYAQWRELHPNTEVLCPPEDQSHPDCRIGHGAEEWFERPGVSAWFLEETLLPPVDTRLDENQMVLAVTHLDKTRIYPLAEAHRQGGVIHDQLAGESIVVWAGPDRDSFTMAAFSAKAHGDEVLTFEQKDGHFHDQHGQVWQVDGRAADGSARLTQLQTCYLRWHGWAWGHLENDLYEGEQFPSAQVDTSDFSDVLPKLEAGFDVQIIATCIDLTLPNEALSGLKLTLSGDPFHLYRFPTRRAAQDFLFTYPQGLRAANFVLISTPPLNACFDSPLHGQRLDDKDIPFSLSLYSGSLKACFNLPEPQLEGLGLSQVVDHLRTCGYAVALGEEQFLEGASANIFRIEAPRGQLRVGAINAYLLKIEEDPFIVYHFQDEKAAEAYLELGHKAIGKGPFVFRSMPEDMFLLNKYRMAQKPDRVVKWSGLLQDKDFAHALDNLALNAPPQQKAKVYKVSELAPNDFYPKPPKVETFPKQTAYVIYTSGSTGTPKGVPISHENLRATLEPMIANLGLQSGDRAIHVASLGFDAATGHLFSALCAGATVCLSSGDKARMADEIPYILSHRKVNFAPFPAPVLAALASKPYPDLRAITSGGEALSGHVVSQWSRNRKLFNMYGPTEATIFTTMHLCSEDEQAPSIGKAIQGKHVVLANEQMHQVAEGESGEILLGGSLSRGYLQQPARTAMSFVPDPFSKIPGSRLYRSGDLGRLDGDGNLYFKGRIDDQVKIRGFRVELGEIEARLEAHAGVAEAVVVVVGQEDVKSLVAHWRPIQEPPTPERDVIHFLTETLPEHMVPDAFYTHGSLPLTPHGKVDRKALASWTVSQEENEPYRAPENKLEEEIARQWANLFSLERVSTDVDFFSLGGNSLLALRAVQELSEWLGRDVHMPMLFQAPTIVELARMLKAEASVLEGEEEHEGRDWLITPTADFSPLNKTQMSIWLGQQAHPGRALFNVSTFMRVQGSFAIAIWEQAYGDMQKHHVALQLNVGIHESKAVQWITDTPHCVTVIDLSQLALSEEQALDLLKKYGRQMIVGKLLFRSLVVRLGPSEVVCLDVFHHLIIDGMGMYHLAQQVTHTYDALLLEVDPQLPRVRGQLALGVRESEKIQARISAHSRHWREHWQELPRPVFPLSDALPGYANHLELDLYRQDWDSLVRAAKHLSISNFQLLLGLWILTINRITGRRRMVIGVPLFPKDARYADEVGMYTETMPLAFPRVEEAAPTAWFHEIAAFWRKHRAHRDFPFASHAIDPEKGRSIQMDAILNYIHLAEDISVRGAQSRFQYLDTGHMANLLLQVVRTPSGVVASIAHNPSVLSVWEASCFQREFIYLVRHLTGLLSVPFLEWKPPAQTLSGARVAITAIEPNPGLREAPLSQAQLRLWLLAQIEGPSAVYSIPIHYTLQGPISVHAMERAIDRLVSRHKVLRTCVERDDYGEPLQVLTTIQGPYGNVIDLSGLTADTRDALTRKLVRQEADKPFDLEKAPLMRSLLIRHSHNHHLWLWNMHHMIADGGSVDVLQKELSTFYTEALRRKESLLEPHSISYLDYAVWQREQDHRQADALAWWQAQLRNLPQQSTFPGDFPRGSRQTFAGAHVPFRLDRRETEALVHFAREHHTTPFTVVTAAFSWMLSHYCGRDDVAVGTPYSQRNVPDLNPLIGLFLNTLVVRGDLSQDPTPAELCLRYKTILEGCFANADCPFEQVIEAIQPIRDLSHSPLFQVMISWQYSAGEALRLPGVAVQAPEREVNVSRFDLTLFAGEGEDGIVGEFEYNVDLYQRASIQQLAEQLRTLLHMFVAHPKVHLSRLSWQAPLAADILHAWQAPFKVPAVEDPVALFRQSALKDPEKIALMTDRLGISYEHLFAAVDTLSSQLAARGIGVGCVVAVCMDRRPELLITLLGVLQTGAAYLPLDPHYPQDRLAYMLLDTNAQLLLTTRNHDLVHEGSTLLLEDLFQESAQGFSPVITDGQQPAYVIYTSGSTGRPKGVVVPRLAMANFLQSMAHSPGFRAENRLLAVTSISFDISVLELFLPLSVGGSLVLAQQHQVTDGRALHRMIEELAIDTMQATPATWRLLLGSGWMGGDHFRAMCGGEALPSDLAQALGEKAGQLWNMYGPTETTIWSAVRQLEAEFETHSSPRPNALLGGPIDNTRIYILDKNLRELPLGVAGEVYIGGYGLAQGYWHQPGLTASRFLPDPHQQDAPGMRMYRVGDIARHLHTGSGLALEFLGRTDHQVKIRGFRIEIGEVEQTILRHRSVDVCAVLPKVWAGEKQLVAFIVGSDIQATTLVSHAAASLPGYMVPAHFEVLDAMPQTPNGKIDRKALDKMELSLDRLGDDENTADWREYQAPGSNMEQGLVAIWETVLGRQPIGVHDDFFELGGNSLTAVRIQVEVEHAFGRPLEVATLFAKPTVAALAQELESGHRDEPLSTVVPLRRGGKGTPLYCIGGLYLYRHLANHILDRDVFGVFIQVEEQAYRHAMGEQPEEKHLTVEQMVDLYLGQLRKVRPEGPYCLAGISFGGVLAYEMARRLRQLGEEVLFLGLFDPVLKSAVRTRKLARLLHIGKRALTRPTSILEKLKGPEIMGKFEPEVADLVRARQRLYMEAVANFEPGTFDGELHLFRAKNNYPPYIKVDPLLGWKGSASKNIEVFDLEGEHLEILEEPLVQDLADILNKNLPD